MPGFPLSPRRRTGAGELARYAPLPPLCTRWDGSLLLAPGGVRRWRRSALPKAPWYGTQPIPVFARCRLSGPLCLLLGCCCCRPLSGWPLLTTRGRISRPADGRGIGGDSATVAVGPNCRSSRCWCQPLTYTRRYAVRRSGDWRRVGRNGPAGLRSAGTPGLRAATIHTTTPRARQQAAIVNERPRRRDAEARLGLRRRRGDSRSAWWTRGVDGGLD